ncbi:hypothetical protein ABZ639_14660 [Saccharomonospora sp. NPDC006951]
MNEDFYRKVGGIRQPDPTLGRNVPKPGQQSEFEQAVEQARAPEQPQKARRQRVVLAEPSKAQSTLRARVELEQQTSWGELLIKDLIKAQFKTGVLLAALVLVVLGSLPLAFFLSPDFASLRLIGIPVAWLLLGVAPFPLLFGVGLWYNRLAERHERDFVDMIEN